MLWLLTLFGLLVGSPALPTPAELEIKSLPGLAYKPNFKQYSGYIEATPGTFLFMWFVESQRSPENDPVCLWMNGGPGASSVAYGFWSEMGPFKLNKTGQIHDNPYSWNKVANMLYVEAPSGVGFSYSENRAHYKTNDSQTAIDNYHFLLNWFKVFKQFQKNDFYVTGESYGGHYVPQLSMQILENKNSINMKGFIVGNPGINSDWYYNINEYAFQTFLWSHALLPEDAYRASFDACDWTDFTNMKYCSKNFTNPNAACVAANRAAFKYIPKVWDPYNILAPTCHTPGDEGDKFVSMYTPFLDHLRLKYDIGTHYNPCATRWTPPYMRQDDVIKAVHAKKLTDRKWPSPPADWQYGNERQDIAKLFPTFFEKAPHWRIAIYSGAADSAVPFMGTERWINCLKRPVETEWYNWFYEKDVAGSVKKWDKIMFFTIKGCGHTVPSYCPPQSLEYFSKWLDNTL
eukprot:TRINITY_DN35136_c0_g1_i1.p1 TRINITY_DN35136_c0_g1~~TRINITY_DN35136_c0_g1_i1.p1  ORF type:complete len:460 (-),score=60.53 TRINITY_DN35136_c0_g1_i1:63-1442(-)